MPHRGDSDDPNVAKASRMEAPGNFAVEPTGVAGSLYLHETLRSTTQNRRRWHMESMLVALPRVRATAGFAERRVADDDTYLEPGDSGGPLVNSAHRLPAGKSRGR